MSSDHAMQTAFYMQECEEAAARRAEGGKGVECEGQRERCLACFYDQPTARLRVGTEQAGSGLVTFIVGCDYFMTAMRLLRRGRGRRLRAGGQPAREAE